MTGRDTYRNRCPECDAHLFGVDSCEFCDTCREEGIVNGRSPDDRRRRRQSIGGGA